MDNSSTQLPEYFLKRHTRFREDGSFECTRYWIWGGEEKGVDNYIGQMKNGRYNGYGNMIFDDKYFINGQWNDGTFVKGIIHNLKNDTKTYITK